MRDGYRFTQDAIDGVLAFSTVGLKCRWVRLVVGPCDIAADTAFPSATKTLKNAALNVAGKRFFPVVMSIGTARTHNTRVTAPCWDFDTQGVEVSQHGTPRYSTVRTAPAGHHVESRRDTANGSGNHSGGSGDANQAACGAGRKRHSRDSALYCVRRFAYDNTPGPVAAHSAGPIHFRVFDVIQRIVQSRAV